MSKKHANEQGITPRHGRSCASRDGGRCDCKPTHQAQAWDARTNKRLTKTFPTVTAARQWKRDVEAALHVGTMSGEVPTAENLRSDLVEGARKEAVHDA